MNTGTEILNSAIKEHPLDKIIAEQAAYYGMSVSQYEKWSLGNAIAQEMAEHTEEFQYEDDRYA